jgi:hypothetical protein
MHSIIFWKVGKRFAEFILVEENEQYKKNNRYKLNASSFGGADTQLNTTHRIYEKRDTW